MKAKNWLMGWLVLSAAALGVLGTCVYRVDPYMHFHGPDTDSYYYTLDNQRSQNDGIVKHFDYDAVITGTSMTENFRSSEADALFGIRSVKVPFNGAPFKEINDILITAKKNNPGLKTVIRCIDTGMLFRDKDAVRTDMGKHPTYLYDSNPFNDVEYVLNRDVLWGRTFPMIADARIKGEAPGITSFDDYSDWQHKVKFGIRTVCPKGIGEAVPGEQKPLTEAERENIRANIAQNVTDFADANPDMTFYYFFPPYSAVWWKSCLEDGILERQLEAEEYAIRLILESENIRLFSFNCREDILTDLNHYKDSAHYGAWVNSAILRWMRDGEYQLTKENVDAYLQREREVIRSFDYAAMNEQPDYEDDTYAAELLLQEFQR